jgi:hypothetical protein
MEDVTKTLVTLLVGGFGGGILVAIIIVLLIALNPEKFEIWVSLFFRILSHCGNLFRSVHKAYVKHDLQGRVNDFTKGLRKDAPFLAETRVKLEYVDTDVDRKSFLAEGQVIVRVRRSDPLDTNFVHAVYLFVAAVLLHKAKRYISPSHRKALDLYVTHKMINRAKPNVIDIILEEYLHPQLADTTSKVSALFDAFARLDDRGWFFHVFLQELYFLGQKVFEKRQDSQIISEVNGLISWLEKLADRKIGEEGDLDFEGQYCRFAVLIVGKRPKLAKPDIYVWHITNTLLPKNIETIYVAGRLEHQTILDGVCQAVCDTYEPHRSQKTRVTVNYGNDRRSLDQYLVILRLKGARVFQPSE